MIDRSQHLQALQRLLARFPIVGLLGARQVGKTTLAKALSGARRVPITRFDLEDPVAIAAERERGSQFLREDPAFRERVPVF